MELPGHFLAFIDVASPFVKREIEYTFDIEKFEAQSTRGEDRLTIRIGTDH